MQLLFFLLFLFLIERTFNRPLCRWLINLWKASFLFRNRSRGVRFWRHGKKYTWRVKARKLIPRYIISTRYTDVVKNAEILTRRRRLINDIYDRRWRARENFRECKRKKKKKEKRNISSRASAKINTIFRLPLPCLARYLSLAYFLEYLLPINMYEIRISDEFWNFDNFRGTNIFRR